MSHAIETAGRRLAVRLAANEADIIAAQRLRYDIFFRDLGASAGRDDADGRDIDPYDMLCDHLLVEDHARPGSPVVGTAATGGLVRASAAATPDATPMIASSAVTMIQNHRGVPPRATRSIRMRR